MRTLMLTVLVLPMVLTATGCGRRDPVQLELREYQRLVIGPINAGEERFQEELARAEAARPGEALTPEELLPVFRESLLPIYQEILSRAKAHTPRSPQVAAVHAEVLRFYEVGVRDLERCVDALVARDLEALEQAQQAMLGRDADGLSGRLERLYRKHELSLE